MDDLNIYHSNNDNKILHVLNKTETMSLLSSLKRNYLHDSSMNYL